MFIFEYVADVQVVTDDRKKAGAVALISSIKVASSSAVPSVRFTSRHRSLHPPLQPVPQDDLSTNPITGLPLTWTPMSVSNGGAPNQFQIVEVVPKLMGDNSEFHEALRLFELPDRKIHRIFRVQNPTLYQQYMAERKKMHRMYDSTTYCNELYLFHGTKRANVENINANGFDRSYAGANATLLGMGAYFARDVRFSAQDKYSLVDQSSGHKFVYVARVLVGRFCQGAPNMQHPPNQGNQAGCPFDSAVDNVAEPTVFVIFRDTRAYPLYLFEFS